MTTVELGVKGAGPDKYVFAALRGKSVMCGNIQRWPMARVVMRDSVEGQQAEMIGAMGEAVGG